MKIFYLSFLFFYLISCGQETTSFKNEYPPRHIGDIEFDPKLDNPDFKLCYPEHIDQYIGEDFLYEGEKIALEKEILDNYRTEIAKKESGMIRVRFIVNCKGETDRFRILGADKNYKEKEFDKSITNQILQITKNLKGWKIMYYRNEKLELPIDYYQYLIFKIENGKIVKILP